MSPRGTDWGLAALVASLVVTGALTLFAGGSADAWVFAAHDALGLAITLLLAVKLRRVWARLRPRRWDGRTLAGALGATVAVAALASGTLWAAGLTPDLAGYSLLSWHDALGVAVALTVLVHALLRAKPLRARDVSNRRQFLTALGIAAGSVLAWRAQRPLEAVLRMRGAKRRFTGSYEQASFAGNAFPATSWVADDPRPIEARSYRLLIDGLVTQRLALSLAELSPVDELVATLDCTGGFYSTQRWRGIALARLLARAAPQAEARHLRVVSRTGYRWSFSLQDVHALLLATHVGEEPLSHEHGAPVRLVVPGARGFQWIKWVERVDLLEHPDLAAPASTIWSSFSPAGRGDA